MTETYIRYCKKCSAKFETKNNRKIYCSVRCKLNFNTIKNKSKIEQNFLKKNPQFSSYKEYKAFLWQKYKENTPKEKLKYRHYSYRYKISEDDFLALNRVKNCQICENLLPKINLDHCHKTGKIRGVLCKNCNVGLGNFFDNISLLQKAIDYLKNN